MSRLTEHPDLARNIEQGQLLCLMYQARRWGVAVPGGFEALERDMKVVNTNIDGIYERDFPRLHRERVIEAKLLEHADIIEIECKWTRRGSRAFPLLKLAPELAEFAAFVCAEYRFPLNELPVLKVVHPSPDNDRWIGLYTPPALVQIKSDLSEEMMHRVLAHELAHHHEERQGWPGSEAYAHGESQRLCDLWYERQRAGSRWWDHAA